MNICFDHDSSRESSNNNTCNILSCLTVLIWVGTVTCEAFSLTERIWFCLYSSWIEVDDITSRSQKKHVKLSSKCNSQLSHERSSLFQCSLNHFQASKLSLCAILSSINVTTRKPSLISCFEKSNFWWQSAEIRLPDHLVSIYVK